MCSLPPMPTSFIATSTATPVNLFREEDLSLQRAFFAARSDLSPTPLRSCPSLARRLGIGALLVKDETSRFGLNAFKATGALFAVGTLLQRGEIHPGDTLACASEGNHGRAVARAAREVHCRARVYMSRRVTAARVQSIESEAADVVLVDGTYDDAVREMAREAAARGWVVVSDTSWPGYTEVPWLIMLGYTRILDEVAAALAASPVGAGTTGESKTPPRGFDVIFVPAGVGGLLAAVACWCDLTYGAARPKVVAVEPETAACVQASARAGRVTAVPGPFDTTMGGLRCGEMSPSVFPAVSSLVDACIGIDDEHAFRAMRQLARPVAPDPAIECGPSGAAALGGLLAVQDGSAGDVFAAHIGLTPEARVVVLATEGKTEPELYLKVMARP
jgi:diaminopropionate ammonia-lyase